MSIPIDLEIIVVGNADGFITLSAEIPYELSEGAISMTIARDSYQIKAYSMSLGSRIVCCHTTEAWNGKYGIEIEIPEEIRIGGGSS